MPSSWIDDSSYISGLKSGFSVNGVAVSGTNNFDYFVDFISALQSTLNSNGMTEVGAEFETMKIAYPFTIRKYRARHRLLAHDLKKGLKTRILQTI